MTYGLRNFTIDIEYATGTDSNQLEAKLRSIQFTTFAEGEQFEIAQNIFQYRVETPAITGRIDSTSIYPPPSPRQSCTGTIGVSSSTSMCSLTMSTKSLMVIGGVGIPIAATKRVVSKATTAFYKKADRDLLSGDT